MRRLPTALLILLLFSGSGCIWKLWSDGPPPEERIHDIYGTLRSISQTELIIETNKNQEMKFQMMPSSVRGSSFEPGVRVHVYYRLDEDAKQVTMVVKKIG